MKLKKDRIKDREISNEPMKLLYSYGCTANELSVDGESEIYLTDDKRREVLERIFKWYYDHPEELNPLLADFVERYGECEIGTYCEQCHDTPYIYEMEI